MQLSTTDQEFQLLRDFMYEQTGILLKKNNKYIVDNRLSHLVTEAGCKTYNEFYWKLKHSSSSGNLRDLLVDAITTKETLWMRDSQPFRALSKRIIPEFQQKINSGNITKINIWSAACSTGQEPYSIAMAAMECYTKSGSRRFCRDQVKILATDISNSALTIAKEGRYNKTVISRGLTEAYLSRYFKEVKNEWLISDEIKEMVLFNIFNLKNPISSIFGTFNLIFLRNVIIYFSNPFKQILIERVARALKPGGYLFLGVGESIHGYTEAFEIIHDKGGVYYQLKS